MALITFHEVQPTAHPPMRAAKNGAGQLPDRHHRCEPVRTASGLGWHVFLPLDFQLIFDGHNDVLVSLDDGDEWIPLTSLHYPDVYERFAAHAPHDVKDYVQPFLQVAEDHAIVQVWTGYLVRTAPGYSSLVRAPANIVPSGGYFAYEGVIETDRWFGPLFTNIRLLRTDAPIHFHSHRPFLQVVPVHRREYADEYLNDFTVHAGFDGMTTEDWDAYRQTVVVPNSNPLTRRQGAYAVAARKRRAAEER